MVNVDLSEDLMAEWLGGNRLPDYGLVNKAVLADLSARLSEGYLMKVDFGAMLYALETRPPFLDHRLVERALSLPESFKVRHGSVKWIWKEIVKDHLPDTIIKRRKMGFGIPIIAWMRNELYGYLQERLLAGNPRLYEYMNKATIEQLLKDHKDGRADYSNHIWSLLLLEMWLTEFFD